MIEHLIAQLGEQLDLTAEELADVIWLTLIRQQGATADSTAANTEVETVVEQRSPATPISPSSPPVKPPIPNRQQTSEPVAGIAPRRSTPPFNNTEGKRSSVSRSQATPLDCPPIKVANPPSIRDPLALVRSLRPLMQAVPSGEIEGLDEQATAQHIAEAGIWQPIVKPALEPWLELVLVADESASMLIWRQTVLEFRRLLRNYGAFRDVQLWGLHWESDPPQPPLKRGENRLCLRPGIGAEARLRTPRQPTELLDPSGRRLILLITDGVSPHWQSQAFVQTLKLWTQYSPVAIAQVLPEWLWVRTTFRDFESVQLAALEPGVPNRQLVVDWSSAWQVESAPNAGVCVPIVLLEPDSVLTWSQMVMGQSAAPGYWLQARALESEPSESPSLSPEQRVERFRVMSSPVAQRLMGLLAASPVITLPVIRLIQETLLPQSRQMNVAEVLLGGLLEPTQLPQLGVNPDEVEYRFVDEGIRERLLEETPVPDTVQVLSEYIERQFNRSLDEFVAQLQVWSQSEDAALVEKTRPFARVTASVLKRKGGRYREFVEQIETRVASDPPNPPYQGGNKSFHPTAPPNQQREEPQPENESTAPASPLNKGGLRGVNSTLQEFEFETAKIAFEEEETLQPFEFEMATVEVQQEGSSRPQPQVVIQRERGQAWGYVERLSETVELEMVAIPEGRFQMGSPKNERERRKNESPQHEVSVPAFFMGKYPVTQAQWRVVAGLPQVERELNPDPSYFKGEDRPVENVSWHDANEFCARLVELTGKPYRLPSEAEWEYACRAGTTTPFHFGELITPELANYDWSSSYGSVEVTKEKDFQGTTPVGRFGVANAFGLYDLHGNIWEWCEDCWHSNYQGAPNDGSAWIDSEAKENASRVLRGGAWFSGSGDCRCAYRLRHLPNPSYYKLGFRVVCAAPRTL